jgi:hypothetical protein
MIAERIHEYVEEFRAFSKLHKVGYGHPHDLMTLPFVMDQSERFRVEMASMVRSVFYREREGVTKAELLRIVAVTWGGEGADRNLRMPELEEFLGGVLNRSPGEPQPIVVLEELDAEVADVEREAPRAAMAAALAMKAKEDSGVIPVREVVAIQQPVRDDPWAEGSFLHLELMRFAEWREQVGVC